MVPRANELVRPGETIRIEPKPMQVLLYLAARAGAVVSRDELMEAVWPGVFVGDHALNRCISQLRKLFGDEAHTPRVIETIPKVGYRLISPVERMGDGFSAPVEAVDVTVTTPREAARLPAAHLRSSAFPKRAGLVGGVVLALAASYALILWNQQAPNTTTRPLTTNSGVEMQAMWSPDGNEIAYVHRDDGAQSIWIRRLDADTPLQLTEGPRDFAPAWSPDGSTISFVRCDPGPCRLFGISPLASDERQILDGPVPAEGGRWFPDGNLMVWSGSSADGGSTGLLRVDLTNGQREILTEPPGGFRDILPRLSPDGVMISFIRRSPAGDDLFRVATSGGEARRLTSDNRTIAGHSWTEDGSAIVYSSSRTGVFALWRVGANGGEPEIVSGPAVRDPGGPAFAPSGDKLVVEDWIFEVNLWETADNEEPTRLVSSTMWDKQPDISPTGGQLAFISNRTGPPEVWRANRDGSDVLRLTNFGGPSVEYPRFSPDGRSIVFQARPDTQAELFIIGADGGVPRKLTTHSADDVAPRWSRDGTHVYFGSNRSGAWQIWMIPATGGEAVQLSTGGGFTAEEADDGALIVSRYAEPGLWRIANGVEERISTLPRTGDWGNWATTSRGLVVLDRAAAKLVLITLGTTGESPFAYSLPVGNLMNGEPGFAVARGGDVLITAQIDRVESDLLIVESFR